MRDSDFRLIQNADSVSY